MANQIKVITTRDVQGMLKNPFYKEYYDRKLVIKEKYPPIKDMSREEHNQYMKEVADLIWENDGPFQKFMWDNKSEFDKIIQDRRARGNRRKNESSITYY